MYELGKWIGRELYYKLTANDEVEVPKDFDEKDHKWFSLLSYWVNMKIKEELDCIQKKQY